MGQIHLAQELRSLGIEPDRANDLNDDKELQALADNLKFKLFQEYKDAYSGNKEY